LPLPQRYRSQTISECRCQAQYGASMYKQEDNWIWGGVVM